MHRVSLSVRLRFDYKYGKVDSDVKQLCFTGNQMGE